MLRRPRTVRPPVSREEYLLRGLTRAFPGGEWVDGMESEAEVAEVPGREPEVSRFESDRSPSVAVIGGLKYDASSLSRYMRELPAGTTVYVGAGRGVESDLAKADGLQVSVQVVDLEPELFGKSARKLNVPQVLVQDISSPVVLVGAGERVKQAQSWLKMVDGLRDEDNRRKVVTLP